MAEITYKWRGNEYTYDQFMDGPGARMGIDKAEATIDKLSGATKTRRALRMAMTKNGYSFVSASSLGVKFKGKNGELSFASFGEVEQYLLKQGWLKDEKEEAKKAKALKKEKAKAKKQTQVKKSADKVKAKADVQKEVSKKESLIKKPVAKKSVSKVKSSGKSVLKSASVQKPVVSKVSKRGPGRPPKSLKSVSVSKTNAARDKKLSKSSAAQAVAKRKDFADDSFTIRIGKKNFNRERIERLAIDAYRFDMNGDSSKIKSIQTILIPETGKCQFIINGKEKGEFEL